MNEANENIELEKLVDIENISVRAYNICAYNKLTDLSKMLQYFWENGDFRKLRNCGNKSNLELIAICNKYKYLTNNTYKTTIAPPTNELNEIIDNLSGKQKSILNNIVSSKFNSLTQRSSNALSKYLGHPITIKNLREHVFSDINFEINSLKNIGRKASKEIELFLKEIVEYIKLVATFDNEHSLTKELLNALLNNLFSIDPKSRGKIYENYDFSVGIPIFKTINILIENNYIFNENEKIVFKHSLGFFRDKTPLTLEETGNKIGMTRERTRQIRNKILSNFNKSFSFIDFLEKENLNFYNLDRTSLILNIDQAFVDELSKNEMVYYNQFFINRVYLILLKDKYYLIGNEEKGVLGYSSRKYHNWNSTYLVSKKIQMLFDFEALIKDIATRLSKKIEEDYNFHFQTYLLNFKKASCFDYLDEISQIAEKLLYNEFEMIIDSEEHINFSKNSIKTVNDYIHDTLKTENKPLTAYKIFDLLNQQHHGILKSVVAVRSSCQRDTRLIYFGRSSTYGLKKWEKKHNNIKGGTMHDISEEFLLKFDEPKQIGEIVKYVSRFRNNVTSRNLFYNLKSAEHRRFVFLKNRFIGLVSKSYDTDFFQTVPKHYKNKRSWEENFQLLEKFTSENKRLPRSSANEDETKLYRYFNIQVRKLSELDVTKKELIGQLMHKFNYKKGIRHNNLKRDNSYNELFSFIHKYGKAPSMRISSEQKLCSFYYSQRNLYKSGKLSEEYLSKFLKVTKMIKNIAK